MEKTVVFVALLQVLVRQSSSAPAGSSSLGSGDGAVCTTKVCQDTARVFLSAMDLTASPCQDFYQFACGNFLRNNPATILKPVKGPFYDAVESQGVNVRGVLESYQLRGDEVDAKSNAVRLYRSCKRSVSTRSERAANTEYLKGLLQEFFGGWPLLTGAWNSSRYDMGSFFGKVTRQLDTGFFLVAKVAPDPVDAGRYIMMLAHEDPTAARSSFLKSTVQVGKLDYQEGLDQDTIIRLVVCTLDPGCQENPYLQSDIQQLAQTLRNIQNSDSPLYAFKRLLSADVLDYFPMKYNYNDSIDFDDYKFTVAQMTQRIPEVNWQNYFKHLFVNTSFTPGDDFKVLVDLDVTTSVINVLLNNIGDTRAIVNLFGWVLVSRWGPIFSPQLRALLAAGVDHEDLCAGLVNNNLGYAVARMYNDKHVGQEDISEVNQVIEELKEGFKQLLQENSWMDHSTKQHAFNKINNMVKSVSEPAWIRNDSQLNSYYAPQVALTIESNFREGFGKVKMGAFVNMANRIGKPVDRINEWPIESPAITNAFYSPMTNAMYYGSGMMQYPFYVQGRPKAINFGSLGYIAGHEITHGFDTQGSTRNERGEVENWWSETSKSGFAQRTSCFIEQYGSILEPITNLRLNGELTVGENIADNGGIREAFKAYKSISKLAGGRLSGLELWNEDQLFFLSAAHTYCTSSTPEYMRAQILKDEHSPNIYRVIVPFQNSEDFSEAFNCSSKTFMNPVDKCRIW